MKHASIITRLQIHPAIGIARVGDSPNAFYLAPETTGGVPIACDDDGNALIDPVTGQERPVQRYKDAEGRIKRQGARFGVYTLGEDGKLQLLKIGDTIQTLTGPGTVTDIKWTAYLANKKAVWYTFKQLDGEHGYSSDHPLRNASITDSEDRQKLIIDPGPRTINARSEPTRASFSRDSATGGVYTTFPPENLKPFSVDTLGDIMTDRNGRLIVLGGRGCSGSMGTEFSDPKISTYANNDNWFDDTSDGPVMAIIHYYDPADDAVRLMEVEHPAWVIVGYPRYAPPIVDLITLDDLLYDLYIKKFAYRPHIYGPGNFQDPQQVDTADADALQFWRDQPKWFNTEYYPDFNTEIYPILTRPFNYQWVTNFLGISFPAHEVNYRGDFDMSKISYPPKVVRTQQEVHVRGMEAGEPAVVELREIHKAHQRVREHAALKTAAVGREAGSPDLTPAGNGHPGAEVHTSINPSDPTDVRDGATPLDPYRYMRTFIYQSLRGPGEENLLRRDFGRIDNPLWKKELMPLLCGDNPLSNSSPSKFLRLTDTQLFLLHQWAVGKFRNDTPINECSIQPFPTGQEYINNEPLTRGVLGNALGGSFCPGAEVSWIIRNPSIFSAPWRIKANPAFIPTAGSSVISQNNPFIQAGLSQTEDLSIGLEPGDLTKRSGVPWQSDFNECYDQPIDVTYDLFNNINPNVPVDPGVAKNQVNLTMWWPSHRPMQVFLPNGNQIEWSAYIPQTNEGDLKMVTAWKEFGFLVRGPQPASYPPYIEVERNPDWIPDTDN